MAAQATDAHTRQRTSLSAFPSFSSTDFWGGWLLLVVLITLYLSKPLFSGRPLLAADLLFQLDPLWQPLAPSTYVAPANPVLSDQVFEFYPWQHFIRAELAQGRLPLWNPLANSGHPLLANAQTAVFDPFNVVARFVPLAQSFVVLAFLRLLCAGTFMLLLALAMGLSRWAAYLAMIVFAFALPQVVWLLYPKASVLVWVPALLYFSLRVLHQGQWRDVAVVGVVIAAQLVGGHPETALFSALLWMIFCAYWWWIMRAAPAQRPTRALWQLAVAGGLGLGAGAVQWLPTAEALWHSEILAARSQSVWTWQTVFGRWHDWLATLTLLLPNFFGNPRHANYWFPYSNFTEQTLYVGVLPLASALLVYVQRGMARAAVFWATLAAVTLVLALRVPPFSLLAEVPGLNVTNVGRLRHFFMLAVAMLAGYGLETLRQALLAGENGRALRRLTQIVSALGVVAALIAVCAYALVWYFQAELIALGQAQARAAQGDPFLFRTPQEYLALAAVRVEQMLASFHPSNWTMYWPLMLALVLIAARLLLRHLRLNAVRRAQALTFLMLTLTVGELWLFGFDYNPTLAPEDLYPTPPLVAELLHQDPPGVGPPYRVMGTGITLIPNVSMIYALEDVRGYDPIALQRYMALMSRLPGAVRAGHHLLFTQADAPLLDLLNVRYLFTPQAVGDGRWSLLAEAGDMKLYRNQNALPRAFMVYRSQVAASPDAALAMTLAPEFDFRNSVVLEGEKAPALDAQPARAPVVTITHYRPGALTIAVETVQPGLLVVADAYTPGWRATIDGQETELWLANYALRAVLVPEGSHTVTLTYQPLSVRIGAWSSSVSGGVLLLLFVFGRRRSEM